MADRVASHYGEHLELTGAIAEKLRSAGKNLNDLTTADLGVVDEFHIRGRKATLELGAAMNLTSRSYVLDIGSGLGGPARTLAETYGCRVAGIDLTKAFCDAATAMSGWVGLESRVSFEQGDATQLPFEDGTFDAAMTIHVAMNIAAKDKVRMARDQPVQRLQIAGIIAFPGMQGRHDRPAGGGGGIEHVERAHALERPAAADMPL